VGSTPIDFVWQGTLASFDDYIFDLLRGLLDAIPAERHQDFEAELQAAGRALAHDGRLQRTGPVIVVSGQTPPRPSPQ
jgi:hypothetical protein